MEILQNLLDAIGVTFYPQPYRYRLESSGKANKISHEVRLYEPAWVAHIDMSVFDERKHTTAQRIDMAFNQLAAYFGVRVYPENDMDYAIPMTVPVLMGWKSLQTRNVPIWMEFIMPDEFQVEAPVSSSRTPSALPVPNNPDIQLLQTPMKRYAVCKYNGDSKQNDADYRVRRLATTFIDRKTGFDVLNVEGQVINSSKDVLSHRETLEYVTATYNGPFTPDALRTNEVMLPLHKEGEIFV